MIEINLPFTHTTYENENRVDRQPGLVQTFGPLGNFNNITLSKK